MHADADDTSIILDSFVAKLIQEKGYGDLDKEVKEELHTIVSEDLQRMLYTSILAALTPEQQESLEAMIQRNASETETQAFFQNSIEDYNNFIARVLLDFRRTYLG
jgi:hypothetical protein